MIQQVSFAIMVGALVVVWVGKQQPVIVNIPAQTPQIFGDTLDIWRLVKVSEREAAQTIRRGDRLGYKLVQYMYDRAGSVYILFQLCPVRTQMLGVN